MGKIRVAVIGAGNCASSLIQGVEYYKNAKEDDFVPGVMHVNLGGYHIRDIEFVAAFDIDKNKVGKDLSEAIFTPPNNTTKFSKTMDTRWIWRKSLSSSLARSLKASQKLSAKRHASIS